MRRPSRTCLSAPAVPRRVTLIVMIGIGQYHQMRVRVRVRSRLSPAFRDHEMDWRRYGGKFDSMTWQAKSSCKFVCRKLFAHDVKVADALDALKPTFATEESEAVTMELTGFKEWDAYWVARLAERLPGSATERLVEAHATQEWHKFSRK